MADSFVLCTTCWKWEMRDKNPKVCGDALRDHYAVHHPQEAELRGWDKRKEPRHERVTTEAPRHHLTPKGSL